MKLKPSQLASLLTKVIPARIPILIIGPPGVGKTDIIKQACQASGADIIVVHPVVSDPTDAKGMPWVENGEASFVPFGDLKRILKSTKLTAVVLDDLGQSAPAVQASWMQPILARHINDHKIPDCVTFISASNRRVDRAGVSGILEPVKSRFGTIIELVPDLGDWCTWAMGNNIPPDMIAFLRFRPELLCDFEPSADLTNSPLPRTWNNAARLLGLNLPREVESASISGAVGEGAAAEYLGFRRMYQELPSLDLIIDDPDGQDIPKQPSTLFAVTTGLASKVTRKNFGSIARYAERLNNSGHGEFSALLLRDSTKRNSDVMQTEDFIRLAAGPLGELISGEVQ